MRRSQKFLLGFFVPVVIVFLLVLPNFMFLQNVGELDSGLQIATKMEQGNTCITGLASGRLDTIDYKLQSYSLRKPDVVVVGSSRAMQYTENFFRGSFYNMGGMAADVAELEFTIQEMLKIHTPSVFVITADFWWFNSTSASVWYNQKKGERRWGGAMRIGLLPFLWMVEGKLSANEYREHLLTSTGCQIGMAAFRRREGFLPDGSYFYGDRYITLGSQTYKDAFEKIDLSVGQYKHGTAASVEDVQRLIDLIHEVESHGADVVLVAPPVAPPVKSYMGTASEEAYLYWSEARELLEAGEIEFYDFFSTNVVSFDVCEFIDAHHPGQVVAARILLSLIHSSIGDTLDAKEIKDVIRDQGGLTVDRRLISGFFPGELEVDFLLEGCSKKSKMRDLRGGK